MKHSVVIGQADYTVLVFIPDPASTDGSGKTGLVAANLTVSFTRVETDNDVVVTDATSSLNNLANLTAAHNDWGIFEVSNTLAPGLYRLDLADAVFAAGAWSAVVYVMITTSAAAASPMEFILDASDFTVAKATPTNITAGTITTVTNLTNAPTNGDLTAAMKASVNTEADAALTDYGALKPTVAARTLDVSAGGEAGIDWANVGSPTTALNLSATNIDVDQIVASVSGAVGSVTGAVGSVTGNVGGNVTGTVGSVVGAVGSVTGAVGSVTGNVGGNVAGTVASVVGAVGSVTGNVGGNVAGSVASLTTNNDKTGYALTSGERTSIAEALLKLDLSTITGEAARSVINALRFLRNKWSISGSTLEVCKEDDTTAAWTAAISTDAAAEPVIGVDP